MPAIVKYNFHVFYLVYVLVIGVLYNSANATSKRDIMTDYSRGSSESRSRPLTCDTQILQIICLNKCGKDFICEKDKCKCTKGGESVRITLRLADDMDSKEYANKDADTSLKEKLSAAVPKNQKELTPAEKEVLRPDNPALRHHIAHFCQNLDYARECIRGCMKLGKPAFCGKDHICYCGHKYSSHDKDKRLNINDMYSQFRDLYEKYFGPQTPEIGGDVHSHDDGYDIDEE